MKEEIELYPELFEVWVYEKDIIRLVYKKQ
jgi:hypothetical protein